MKLTDKDAFSNGTEYMMFLDRNCEKCVKMSHYNEKTDQYTQYRCAIQREIDCQMALNQPISERTLKVCNDFIMRGALCPNLQTKRKHYGTAKRDKTQLTLNIEL